MIKRKHLYIPLLIILIIIAFKIQSFVSSKEVSSEQIKIPKEPSKPSQLYEIEDIISKYDSILSSEINESGTVGAAVVITYKNEIALLKCFGVQKAGEKTAINKHTIFRLASVSKTVTGVLAGILAGEGTIEFGDKVCDYIPNFKLKSPESTSEITIGNLLSHTSGLIPHAYDNLIEEHVPINKIMEQLQFVDITAGPGKLYGYQNVMFSLYDTIVSVKTSKKFSLLIKEKIFEPFGMNDSSSSFEDFKSNKNKAFPHAGGNGKFRVLRLNNRYYSTTPAAGINASISDMSHFLLTLLDPGSSLINNHVRKLIFTPQIISPLKRKYLHRWDKVDSKQYAIGWRIIGYKGREVAYHGGYVQGYRAEIALCEEEQIGIAFLSNSPNSTGSKSIPTFLNLLFELKNKENIPNS
ncbi:MAG: beta-lactamase family protein [Draconibacterium sp.]|nr:beta-lactamase family protein [Draconibacterium sp.]